MDNTSEVSTEQVSNNSNDESNNTCNKKQTFKKPFVITQDVIDDCLSTSID